MSSERATQGALVTRRTALGASAGVLLAAPSLVRAEDLGESVTTTAPAGRLRGVRRGGVDVYLGVPYGSAVSGQRRFAPADPAPPWAGVRDAKRLGPPSLQPPGGVYGVGEPAPAEYCLVLNLWVPSQRGVKRPVMFYSHGGGFVSGSGGGRTQDGSNLAREHDVIVVASNHRLGLLGYLYLGDLGGEPYARSGNQGLADILLALGWVHANIAAFGGDPDNVMIFGESGGGAKTSCLYAMPKAAPLFAKAAIQSGPAVRIGQRDTAAQTTRLVLDELGLARTEWRKLLDVPGEAILKAQAALALKHPDTAHGARGIADFAVGGYGPILDVELLPHHPFDPIAPPSAADKPLITGWIDSEATFFAWSSRSFAAFHLDDAQMRLLLAHDLGAGAGGVLDAYRSDRPNATPSELFLAIKSAQIMGLGTLAIAERKVEQARAPIYYYNLAYRSNMKLPGAEVEAGAMHAIDIPLVFDNAEPTTTLLGDRPERRIAARNMSSLWASFARTSVPSAPGQPAWPAYSLQDRATLVIDAECQVVSDRYAAERRAWRALEGS